MTVVENTRECTDLSDDTTVGQKACMASTGSVSNNGKIMKLSATKSLLVICFLLTGNTALADHEWIVTPDRHSGHHSDRGNDRQTHRRSDSPNRRQSNRRSEPVLSSYRGPYLTTYIGGGFGSGGDVVGRFTDNYGDTERVRSGGGFYFEGGLLAALDDYTMLRLTAGYETDWAGRTNGRAAFSRTRFDLMFLRNFGAFDLGVGLTAHTGVDYDCDINSICAGDRDFDNALGYTLEYALTSFNQNSIFGSGHDRRLNPLRSARLGLRFTDIEYTPAFGTTLPTDSEVLDGKSLAMFIGFAM